MPACVGFPPIIGQNPKVLILGTMPSVVSLESEFYYSHPRNAFWPILSTLLQMPAETVAEKKQLIANSPFILWDVLKSCERQGSLDSAIQRPEANDFSVLVTQYPTLQAVAFNGQKAFQLFQTHVLKKQKHLEKRMQDWTLIQLPSTSPANARMNLQQKTETWRAKLANFL